MSPSDEAFAEWGASLGLPYLKFNSKGILAFSSRGLGDFFAERSEELFLFYLIREIQRPDRRVFATALQLCNPKEKFRFPTSVGLKGGHRLSFFIRLPEWGINYPLLDSVFKQMCEMHEQVRAKT
jgi:hypothetical protein